MPSTLGLRKTKDMTRQLVTGYVVNNLPSKTTQLNDRDFTIRMLYKDSY